MHPLLYGFRFLIALFALPLFAVGMSAFVSALKATDKQEIDREVAKVSVTWGLLITALLLGVLNINVM